MKRRKTQFGNSARFVLVSLVGASLFVACSSEDSTSSTPDGTGEVPPTSPYVDEYPESMKKMFEENSIFSIFAELVALTDLAPLFEADGEITIFLPADAAFEKLPEGTLDKLKESENRELLTRILSYHLLDGKVPEMDVKAGSLVMKSGDSVTVEVGDKVGYLMNITMNGVSVLVGDLFAGNSVAHVMGEVLLPPGVDLTTL